MSVKKDKRQRIEKCQKKKKISKYCEWGKCEILQTFEVMCLFIKLNEN
jgi:hypothetical protein